MHARVLCSATSTSKYSEYFRSAVTNVTVWHHRLKYPNPPDCHPRQYPTSLRFLTIQYCKELPGIVENGKFTAGILLLPPFPNIPMSWGGRRKRRALVSGNISTQGPPLVSALHRCSGVWCHFSPAGLGKEVQERMGRGWQFGGRTLHQSFTKKILGRIDSFWN